MENNVVVLSENLVKLYTRKQAAVYLDVSEQTLATWACTRRGGPDYIKIGRNVRYKREDLDGFIEMGRVKGNCIAA